MLNLRSARPGRPLVIGHRGASGEAPENTLASFRLATEQGADLIELDVQRSVDGFLVVIHDPTVDRTTDGHGSVKDLTLAQIKALDAGAHSGAHYAGERIPTLDEVLEWASGKTPVAIEIKNNPVSYPGIEDQLVKTLRRHDAVQSVVVISFDHSAVLRTKQLCTDLACGVLFACSPVAPSSLALQAQAEALLPHWSNLTREMVSEAHARGLAVSPWVVDEESEMKWVLSLGVDALATNHPARLISLLEAGRLPA